MRQKLTLILVISILQTSNAQPYWIGKNNTADIYQSILFIKPFNINSLPDKYVINISADNHFRLYVNGTYVTHGPTKGDAANWYYHAIDIKPYITNGNNLIGVEVVNRGRFRALSEFSNFCGLYVKGTTSLSQSLNTDGTWKMYQCFATFPNMDNHMFVGAREVYFSGNYPHGWQNIDYDHAKWNNAQILTDTIPQKLTNSPIPLMYEQVKKIKSIRWEASKYEPITQQNLNNWLAAKSPVTIEPWSETILLLDAGELTNAFPLLTFSGAIYSNVKLTYAEALFEKPYNYDENKGHRDSVRNKYMRGTRDEIILDNKSMITYSPAYFRTFRYIQLKITTLSEPLTIYPIKYRTTGYPLVANGTFICNDTMLNNIWNTGWRTAKLCALDTYVDCPYYEQLQYIGDTRIQALITLYMSGDDRLIKKALTDFYTSMGADSLTKSRYPDRWGQQIIPPFSLFYISMLHDLLMHTTNDDFIKSHIPAIKKILQWHKNRLNNEGILGPIPYWNFIDWTADWKWVGYDAGSGIPVRAEKEGRCAVHTLQYLMALQKAAFIMSYYNDANAKMYLIEAQDLQTIIHSKYWRPDLNLYADFPDGNSSYSQHCQALAVLTDVCPKNQAKKLVVNMFETKSLIQASYYYRFYLLQAMKHAGMGNEYLGKLEPWKKMLNIGLTTFAERDEPSRSDCHAWSASPNYDFLATVLGVEPNEVGFKSVKISPNIGTLNQVQGTVPHKNGIIMVKYIKHEKSLEANITLPANLYGIFSYNGKTIKLVPGEQNISVK
ncbi:MAG: alpha-L-rhamnosidase C-terminal domain-containing protein [Cytophagales bacterium]|nr:alpha-L-rhamnosidase C-terminal domain-containing protein [Cytophagales bacterium]